MKIFKRKDNLDIEIIDMENNPKNKKAKKIRNKEFVIVTYVVLFLLISLCAYYCYYLLYRSETFINSSYNRRLTTLSEHVIRGNILTRDEVVIATSKGNQRIYPKGREYAHVTGFATNGMSGVEKDSNFSLLRSHAFILERLRNEVFDEKNIGDNVYTTIDSHIQDVAYNCLGNYNGAVIAMDPQTGEIICMVSKPDFDPNYVESNWDSLSNDSESSVLVNRATQGLYPPGSTFKIITALEYLAEGGKDTDIFNCNGSYTLREMTIRCYHGSVHGTQTFVDAFANSCNSVFAEVGLTLNKNKFQKKCDSLLFNTALPTNISGVSKSKFSLNSSSGDYVLMQSAIGQGETLVTPLQMLLIVSAIENDGVLIKPNLIKEIRNYNGDNVKTIKPDTYGSIMSKEEASKMKEYLRAVVTNGTGSKLLNENYDAYGKTGTAEFSSNKDEAHSWFVGFANRNDKNIAIAVIMEGAGAGSEKAVPLAREVFNAYFNNP